MWEVSVFRWYVMQTTQGLITVTVKSREKTLFQGKVSTLSSTNQKGVFDILPLHANFITLVNQKVTMKTEDGKTQEIVVNNGILRFSENAVEIFLGVSSEISS